MPVSRDRDNEIPGRVSEWAVLGGVLRGSSAFIWWALSCYIHAWTARHRGSIGGRPQPAALDLGASSVLELGFARQF